jgi:hypothetical protein
MAFQEQAVLYLRDGRLIAALVSLHFRKSWRIAKRS